MVERLGSYYTDYAVNPDTGTPTFEIPYTGGAKTTLDNLNEALFGPDVTDTNLGQNKYDFTSRVFPPDIGSAGSYNGHYMVININVQNTSGMALVGGNKVFSRLTNELSKTDSLRYSIDPLVSTDRSDGAATSFKLPRYTRRIAESIAIFMPNSELTYTDLHTYDDISLTKFGSAIAGGTAKFAAMGVGGLLGGKVGAKLGGAVGDIMTGAAQAAGSVSQLFGSPINPKVEVLFSNTSQRQFTFEFLMAPSNQKESMIIEQIIRTLRFHAAPELNTGLPGSFFWTPPSEFDITFFNRGEENKKIPRINTCVLTQIDVSYAPSGVYATFHNGYPTQIRMALSFRETEVVHKLRVLQGF
jgi:hypothetical protein